MRIGRDRALGVSLCAIGAIMAWADGAVAQVVTLEELEEAALERHASLARAEARARQAEAAAVGVRSAYHPAVSLGAEGSISPGNELIEVVTPADRRFLVRGSQPLGEPRAFVAIPRYGVTVSVDALIYDFGRTAGVVEAAQAEAGAARVHAVTEGQRVVQGVRSAYLDWLAASMLEQLAQDAVDDTEAMLARTEGRVRGGAVPPAAMTVARLQVAQARLDLVQRREGHQRARLRLQRVAAVDLPEGARPDEEVLDASTATGALQQDADVEALRLEREAALRRARVRERVHRPELRAGLNAGVLGQLEQVFPSYNAGLRFAVPLWDGGEGRAAAVAERAEAAELEASMREHQRAWKLTSAHAEQTAREADTRVELAREVETLARERLEQVTDQHELGAATAEAVAEARAVARRARAEVVVSRVARAAIALGLVEHP
jgi:outer membrane protein